MGLWAIGETSTQILCPFLNRAVCSFVALDEVLNEPGRPGRPKQAARGRGRMEGVACSAALLGGSVLGGPGQGRLVQGQGLRDGQGGPAERGDDAGGPQGGSPGLLVARRSENREKLPGDPASMQCSWWRCSRAPCVPTPQVGHQDWFRCFHLTHLTPEVGQLSSLQCAGEQSVAQSVLLLAAGGQDATKA